MRNISEQTGLSGVPSLSLRKYLLRKKIRTVKRAAPRRTIMSIRSQSGIAFVINAFAASPIRFEVAMDGITPHATVRI